MTSDLNSKFLQFIKQHNLIDYHQKLIIGVSGGKDSMVLAYLMLKNNISFEVAHCNFQLRGNESDKDETFVKEWCLNYNVKIHIQHFDTKAFAKKNKISTEMAARKLRYEWFETLRKTQNAKAVAVAHHQNDQAETLLLNLSRGTGIKGLSGMQIKQENIIRPLLDVSHKEISHFAQTQKINYREDLSNTDIKIKRNRIRHKIIPELQKLNPAFVNTMNDNINRFQGVKNFLEIIFQQMEYELVSYEADNIHIKLPDDHHNYIFIDFMLHLCQKNHISGNIASINSIINSHPGKTVYLNKHIVYKERQALRIVHIKQEKNVDQKIEKFPAHLKYESFRFSFQRLNTFERSNIPKRKNKVWLDADKIELPLKIRPWKAGDKIIPYGLNGKKNIKKILTDAKIDSFRKPNYPVVEDQKQIIWIPGIIPSNKVAITENTQNILEIELY